MTFGNGDYPTTWDEFVGQDLAKRQLRAQCASARVRKVRLDHVLLYSRRAGIGKTSLAQLCIGELGRDYRVVSGRLTANDARIVLADLDDGDVLFYDEIHLAFSAGKSGASWMLHFLQDGVIMGPHGPEEQPDVTVIGATTDIGRLDGPTLDRFLIKPQLADYTDDEAALIAVNLVGRMFPPDMAMISPDNARALARAGNRSPRLIRALVGALRDSALMDPSLHDGEHYDLTEALSWCGVTADGLDDLAQRYLIALVSDFRGGAGERTISSRLGTAGGLGHVEAQLMDKGYLALTPRGRELTGTGIHRAKELIKTAAAA